jgi:hypothetical protein
LILAFIIPVTAVIGCNLLDKDDKTNQTETWSGCLYEGRTESILIGPEKKILDASERK